MPIYEYYCEYCNTKYEAIRNVEECDTPYLCDKCNKECVKTMPSKITWRWGFDEGIWTEEGGRQVYKGKGGPKRIVGGEQLNVHDDLPKMAEDKVSVEEEDKGDYLEEMD